MTDAWNLFLLAAFVDNMPLTLFLGLCTFLALSRRSESAIGLGIAMTGVLGLTVPLNHLIYQGLLAPGAWAWAGMPELDLSYLALIAFIGVIGGASAFGAVGLIIGPVLLTLIGAVVRWVDSVYNPKSDASPPASG